MIKEIGSYIYDETENGAVILECDKNISGDVEIQESFFGVPVVGIAAFAFMKCKRMLGVQIPDSVTEIGRGAFYGCTEMRSAVLPANVRDISRVQKRRFSSKGGVRAFWEPGFSKPVKKSIKDVKSVTLASSDLPRRETTRGTIAYRKNRKLGKPSTHD